VQTHAPEALERAASMEPAAPPWSLLWFGAQVAARNGDYDRVVANLDEIVRGGFAEAEGRNFRFERDYRVLVELGGAWYQLGLQAKGEERRTRMEEARRVYEQALALDPENLGAHWGMTQVCRDLGDDACATRHATEHARYKPDDNARDHAVAEARRRYPAANRAAEAIVIYDLHRPGAYDGPERDEEVARHE
jgi:tetratricopeptide (TPR) repeat protein